MVFKRGDSLVSDRTFPSQRQDALKSATRQMRSGAFPIRTPAYFSLVTIKYSLKNDFSLSNGMRLVRS